jgi:hypothetical protein
MNENDDSFAWVIVLVAFLVAMAASSTFLVALWLGLPFWVVILLGHRLWVKSNEDDS